MRALRRRARQRIQGAVVVVLVLAFTERRGQLSAGASFSVVLGFALAAALARRYLRPAT
jgi:hypothetical protein